MTRDSKASVVRFAWLAFAASLGTAAWLPACGGDDPAPAAECAAPATKACACAGGAAGTATCVNGKYNPCACGAQAVDAGGDDADASAPTDGGASDGGRGDGGGGGGKPTTSDAGFGEYLGPCDETPDCPADHECFAFGTKGKRCTKACTGNEQCPSPSNKCNPRGVCAPPD